LRRLYFMFLSQICVFVPFFFYASYPTHRILIPSSIIRNPKKHLFSVLHFYTLCAPYASFMRNTSACSSQRHYSSLQVFHCISSSLLHSSTTESRHFTVLHPFLTSNHLLIIMATLHLLWWFCSPWVHHQWLLWWGSLASMAFMTLHLLYQLHPVNYGFLGF